MDPRILEKQYMTIAAMYARKVGLWPGQNTVHRLCLSTLTYCVATFALTTQVARVVIDYSLDILLAEIPYICVPVCVIIKHVCYTCNYTKFNELFESILDDWHKQMTKDEKKIMERYAKRGIFYAVLYAGTTAMHRAILLLNKGPMRSVNNSETMSFLFFFVPLLPFILDLILPLNESRPRVHMYDAYYFIEDEENYYYSIMIFTLLSLLLAMVSFIGSDSILICTVQHCCGLLSLAGHRFENSLHKWSTMANHTKMDYRNMYKAVSHSIRTHERALTFLVEIENTYKLSLFLLMGVCCITLTATLLKAGTVTLSSDTYQFYGYLMAQLVHLLFLTAQGQFIINVHETVYEKGYNALWYIADVKTQMLFVLILRQSLTPPMLTAGGLMQLNLDTYAEIVKASVSYFTVLKSM